MNRRNDKVRLTGAVMTHPRRRDEAARLAACAGPAPYDVVVDPRPDGPPTGLRTAVRAWSSVPAGATHHVVLEDDARLAPGFHEHAAEAAAAAPDAALVFHANWCSRSGAVVRLAALAGAPLVRPPAEYTPTVALLLPADVGAGFARYAAGHPPTWPGDVLMARYLKAAGVPTYITVPNLVEHGDLPSVAANDQHGLRLSACFDAPPAGTGWDDAVLHPQAVPFFKNGMALCAVRRPDGSWQTLSGSHGLRRAGLDEARCAEALRAALAGSPDSAALAGPLGAPVLAALWRTAYLTGHLAAGGAAGAAPPDRWDADPLVRSALDTMGPGGLCMTRTAGELTALRRPLGDLVRLALAAGHREPSRPRRSRGTVAVLPAGPHRLGGLLASELAERGYEVTAEDGGDADAVVYVDDASGPARPSAATARRIVRVVTGPAAPAAPPEPGVTVLAAGIPYGPGLLDDAGLHALVSRALMRLPLSVDGGDGQPLDLVHVWDLAEAVAALLAQDGPGAGQAPPGRRPVTRAELAHLVAANVVPVPVEVKDPAPAAPPATPPDTPDGPEPVAGHRLGDGIRTLAQWLAYEAGPPWN